MAEDGRCIHHNRRSFWQKLYDSVPGRGVYKKTTVQVLAERLHKQIEELQEQLHAEDDALLRE